MLPKMHLIPPDRLQGSSLPPPPLRMKQEQVKKREHVTRDPYEEDVKIRKHHPYE